MAEAESEAWRVVVRGRTPDAASADPESGDVTPVAGPAAKIPLKPPHPRHNLNSIRPKHPPKDKNTIVLPGTDVSGDLADISTGRATWQPESNTYEVNGRSYKVESSGTVFPVSGPGLVNLNRYEYRALQQLIGADGNVSAAREALRRDPNVGDSEVTMALEVFRHHKSYRGEP
ncbi:hypothetical protein [Symbioplanes lichenis]|uniref:hypothetical protein n=1 Tax=Symbioplanes lichenis TaxID=1629072 RepID=UPI0027389093|nr:hypothetical protein [Actinoplanes lichenis]